MASSDPTRTLSIRDRFAGATASRFRDVRGAIRSRIEEQGLILSQGQIDAFLNWLQRTENRLVLDRTDRPEIPPSMSWLREYLRQGYAQGVQRTRTQLRQAGKLPAEETGPGAGTVAGIVGAGGIAALLMLPTHEERLDLLHDRTFRDLMAILEAQDADLARTLMDVVDQDLSQQDLISRLNGRVDAVGTHRGRLMARTSIVRAHAEGQLEEMRRLGVREVVGEVEFRTAGDNRVCPRCKALEGTRRSIDEAFGVIPVHPRCRCRWRPVFD